MLARVVMAMNNIHAKRYDKTEDEDGDSNKCKCNKISNIILITSLI